MARTLSTPTHQAVRDFMDPLANRPIKGGGETGSCHSQAYPEGPIAWLVCLHVGPSGGGKAPAQVTIKCDRRTGRVTTVGEPRQDSSTKERLSCPPRILDVAQNLAGRVREKLGVSSDPLFVVVESPAARRARERRESEAEFNDMLAIFGGEG
jgi:hypothetical protein